MNLPPPPVDRFDEPPKSRALFYIFIAGITLLGFCCIGGVVIGLFFPRINMLRDAASRAQSQNNMRQIALALHTYQIGKESAFPYICDFGPGAPSGNGISSLHFAILPYLELENIHELYRVDSPASYYGTPNGVASQTIRLFLSPRETDQNLTMPTHQVTIAAPTAAAPFQNKFYGWYATTNYVANGMVLSTKPDDKPPSLTTVIDGTAQTMMLAERLQVCKSATGDVPTLWGLGAYSAATASFALPVPRGEYPKTTTANLHLQQFVPPAQSAPGGTMPAGFQVAPAPGQCDPRIMQTLHHSGMIVAMFDASCRTIAPSITPATFWAIVTPAGNETVGDDW